MNDFGPWSSNRPTLQKIFNLGLSLEKRWALFEPWYEQIKFGSYARAGQIAIEKLYNIQKIDFDACVEISQKMATDNQTGLYQKVFDQCNIKAVITLCGNPDLQLPLIPTILAGAVFAE